MKYQTWHLLNLWLMQASIRSGGVGRQPKECARKERSREQTDGTHGSCMKGKGVLCSQLASPAGK
jgi:hypothetical protein